MKGQRGFAVLILVIAAIVALGALVAGVMAAINHIDERGFKRGIGEQKEIDQKEFDRINLALSDQKKEAAAVLAKANAENTRIRIDRDKLKSTLENERAQHEQANRDIRAEFAGRSLQFRSSAGEGSGCGGGSGGSQTGGANPAAPVSAQVIQLPEKIAADLRQLTFDADQLNAEYAVCYGFVNKVK